MNLKNLSVILLLTACSLLSALDCSICRRKIKGRYIKDSKGKVYCSENCFARTAPRCTACRNPCIKGSYNLNGKVYCSEKCIDQLNKCENCGNPARPMHTLINQDGDKMQLCSNCTNAPKCYFCAMPYRTQKLYDRRYICQKCSKSAVTSKQQMQSALTRVRRHLKNLFGFDNTHYIELVPVSLHELEKESQGIYFAPGGGRMALMRHEFKIVEKTDIRGRKSTSVQDEKCRIFVLTHTPSDMLDDALAHELTHDFLRHNAGKINDLKIEEGFAEAIAAKFNDYVKKSNLNKRKKINPDPVYGDGYRMMKDMLDRIGFKKTLQFIKSKAEKLY